MAIDILKLEVDLDLDIAAYLANVQRATGAAQQIGTALKGAGTKGTVGFSTTAGAVNKALLPALLRGHLISQFLARGLQSSIDAIRGIIAAANPLPAVLRESFESFTAQGMVEAASEFTEQTSKFREVFKEFTGDANEFIDVFGAAVGRSRLQLTRAMAQFQDTFVPLGFARDKATEMSKALVELGTDLASFNDKADPEVFDRLTSALAGNHEAVRQFGIVITQSSLKAELASRGIVKPIEKITAQEKALARFSLIVKSTQDAQGDAIRTADSFANVMRRIQGVAEDLQVSFGQKLTAAISEMIQEMGGVPAVGKVMETVAATVAATGVEFVRVGLRGVLVFQEWTDQIGGAETAALRFTKGLVYVESVLDTIIKSMTAFVRLSQAAYYLNPLTALVEGPEAGQKAFAHLGEAADAAIALGDSYQSAADRLVTLDAEIQESQARHEALVFQMQEAGGAAEFTGAKYTELIDRMFNAVDSSSAMADSLDDIGGSAGGARSQVSGLSDSVGALNAALGGTQTQAGGATAAFKDLRTAIQSTIKEANRAWEQVGRLGGDPAKDALQPVLDAIRDREDQLASLRQSSSVFNALNSNLKENDVRILELANTWEYLGSQIQSVQNATRSAFLTQEEMSSGLANLIPVQEIERRRQVILASLQEQRAEMLAQHTDAVRLSIEIERQIKLLQEKEAEYGRVSQEITALEELLRSLRDQELQTISTVAAAGDTAAQAFENASVGALMFENRLQGVAAAMALVQQRVAALHASTRMQFGYNYAGENAYNYSGYGYNVTDQFSPQAQGTVPAGQLVSPPGPGFSASPPPSYGTGGYVKEDVAQVEGGEYVMPPVPTRIWMPFLESIRSGRPEPSLMPMASPGGSQTTRATSYGGVTQYVTFNIQNGDARKIATELERLRRQGQRSGVGG